MQHSKNPTFSIDTNSYEFAMLSYTNQEIKETMKYLETSEALKPN